MTVTGYSERVVFTGDVVSVSVRGSVLTATCVPGGAIFDAMVPRFRVQPGCNHALFSVGCGLSREAWEFTATVKTPGAAGWPFTFELEGLARVTGPAPTYSADWFAGGWLQIGGQLLPILRSTNPVSGVLIVTLAGDPSPFPEEDDPVTLWPGCDLRAATCTTKFGNFVNFGGHPQIPVGNPSLVKLSSAVTGGKK